MDSTQEKVVVGVGAEDMTAALELAADEAQRAGCGLHLVRAVHVVAASPEAIAVAADIEAWNRELLQAAVTQVEGIVAREVPVTHALVHGTASSVLIDAGREARMVVVAHRHLSRVARLADRSVANSVAAHLRVPVIAVPSAWASRSDGVVAVGVDVPDRADEVLRVAVAEAHGRGASLRVVHTFTVPSGYGDVLVGSAEVRRWEERARAEVCAALDRLGDETVATEAEVVVRSGRAAEVLVEESGRADLLVLGRHDPLVPIGSHLGPVARGVLREAACPVLLATPKHAHGRLEQMSASGRGGF